MSTQSFDIGFADFDLINPSPMELVTHHRFKLECYCAMNVDDPLAAKCDISATDLHNQPLATLYDEHPTTLQTVRAFEQAEATISPVFRAQYFIGLLPIVEQGIAYSIIDALSIRSYKMQNPASVRRLTFRPFKPTVVLNTTIMMPKHRPLSRMANAFFEQFCGDLNTLSIRTDDIDDVSSPRPED